MDIKGKRSFQVREVREECKIQLNTYGGNYFGHHDWKTNEWF